MASGLVPMQDGTGGMFTSLKITLRNECFGCSK